MGVKLSILDQSIIEPGETATEAFGHTIELAQRAEQLGYYRFWVSEHHDSEGVVGSSPEVLISHLLARTAHIRIGSGGVMLQHYSPYKVAENFNVLAALAPGRVDLGIGRAPGGLPRSTKALQQESASKRTLAEKLAELDQYLHDKLAEDHPLYGLKALPHPEQPAALYLLGTSVASAETAAKQGVPYVFAQFINGDEAVIEKAFATYREQFQADGGRQPEAILALSVIVGDTDEEAKTLASDAKVVKIHLESGNTLTVKTLESAEEYGRQSQENYTIEIKEANVIHGAKETVREKLLAIQQRYAVDELIVTIAVKGFAKRLRSYELLQEAFAELTV